MSKNDLAEHLKFYQELGVDGISRDVTWRKRPVDATSVPPGDLRPPG